MKYSKQLVREISEWVTEHGLMDYGGATLTSYCAHFRFDTETHYRWLRKVEYAEALENAKEVYKKNLAQKLSDTLADMATGGQEYRKVKRHKEYRATADGKQGRLERITEDEEVQVAKPNLGAAIFLLTNLEPEKYRNRQNVESNVKVEKAEELSREDALKELARLEELENLNDQEDNGGDEE